MQQIFFATNSEENKKATVVLNLEDGEKRRNLCAAVSFNTCPTFPRHLSVPAEADTGFVIAVDEYTKRRPSQGRCLDLMGRSYCRCHLAILLSSSSCACFADLVLVAISFVFVGRKLSLTKPYLRLFSSFCQIYRRKTKIEN